MRPRKQLTAATLLLIGVMLNAPAQAGFIGTTFDYCTDFATVPPVTDDPAACNASSVGGAGTNVLIGAGIEIPGGSGRQIDIADELIDILWEYPGGSPSDDLFVLSNLAPFTSLALIGPNLIDVAFTFDGAAGTIGFLVQEPLATTSTTVSFAVGFEDPNPVPAPASLALFGLGLAGLGWSRRKKA